MIRSEVYENAVVRQSARAEEARRLAELYDAAGGDELARHYRKLEAGHRELARQIESEVIVDVPVE